jgi:hypothetical protein
MAKGLYARCVQNVFTNQCSGSGIGEESNANNSSDGSRFASVRGILLCLLAKA